MNRIYFLFWCFLLVVPTLALAAQKLGVTALIIKTQGGDHTFSIEVAQTKEQQTAGLMFREHLDPDKGMLFIFDKPRYISMWMKNTLIPLDMLFIDAAGKIQQIESNTKPESLTQIPSQAEVLAVLELKGGITKKLGISAGDYIEHELFKK